MGFLHDVLTFGHDVLVNLFTGVVAGIISSALTFAYLRVLEWRRARRLWRLTDPAHLTVVVATSQAPRHLPGSTRPGTGVGQLRGIALLAPLLVRGYGRALRPDMLMLSADAREEDTRGDLIVLGGPRTNEIAALICDTPGLPVYMRDAPPAGESGPIDSRIHWAPPGQDPVPLPTADEGEWAYGLVLRTKNVLVSESPGRLLMVAGSSTFGTQAAAEWLVANQKVLRKAPDTAAFVVRARMIGKPARGIHRPETYYPKANMRAGHA